MLANQISKNKDIFCTFDTPLPELFQIMIDKKCSCVAIVESLVHRNIIGVVTEHDICLKTIADGLNPQRISAGRVMNSHITTISEDATVTECSEILKQQNEARIFVIDDNGAYCGVLTEEDLKQEISINKLAQIVSNLNVLPPLSKEVQFAYQ